MVQILDRPKTNGELLREGFSSGADALIKAFVPLAKRQLGTQPKSLDLKGMAAAKRDLKTLYGNKFTDEHLDELSNQYFKFLQENPGVDPNQALEHIVNQYSGQLDEQGILAGEGTAWEKAQAKTKAGHQFGVLGEYLEPAVETAKKHPWQLAKELPTAAIKSAENVASFQDPVQALISQFTGKQPLQASQVLSQQLRKNLPEEEKEGAERIAQTESFLIDMLGPSLGSKLAKMFTTPAAAGTIENMLQNIRPGIEKATPILEKRAAEAAAKLAQKQTSEKTSTFAKALSPKRAIAAEEVAPASRNISKVPPQTGVELRMQRLEPTERLHKTPEQLALREEQIKLAPQYEAEIAEDAAARAAREEARRPKTSVGELSQAKRIEAAEKRLPEVKDAYYRSAARVRALEDELVRLKGDPRKQVEGVIEAAKKELQEAEFELKQSIANLKGGSVRAGIPQMRQAAADKIEKIGQMAAEGEEIKLAKMDYSPKMIAQAKKISSQKTKLPANRTNDFYTQVHDTYADVYKQRLAQIENELKEAVNQAPLARMYKTQQLHKEREAIKKIIDSAEAENVIGRHKLALRELGERKKAADRFAKLKPAEGKKEVSKVAEQKMWKQKMEKATTSEAKEKVIDEGIQKIAQENPESAAKIEQEGETLKDHIKKMQSMKEGVQSPPANQSPKKEISWAKERAEEFVQYFKEFKEKLPNIFSSKMGRDIVGGILSPLIDEITKEFDLPAGGSTLLAVASGGKNYSRGGIRGIVNLATKKIIKEIYIAKAEKAYKSNDIRKFKSYSTSIQKKVKEKSRR